MLSYESLTIKELTIDSSQPSNKPVLATALDTAGTNLRDDGCIPSECSMSPDGSCITISCIITCPDYRTFLSRPDIISDFEFSLGKHPQTVLCVQTQISLAERAFSTKISFRIAQTKGYSFSQVESVENVSVLERIANSIFCLKYSLPPTNVIDIGKLHISNAASDEDKMGAFITNQLNQASDFVIQAILAQRDIPAIYTKTDMSERFVGTGSQQMDYFVKAHSPLRSIADRANLGQLFSETRRDIPGLQSIV